MTRTTICIVLGLLWVASGPASAQAEAPPSTETVRGWLNDAVVAFRAGRYAEALAAFRRAEPHAAALGGRAPIRFNIARCLDELGRSIEAIEAFEHYLEFPDQPEPRRRAKARIKALEADTYGALTVQCDPPGAGLKLVGPTERAGTCPARWRRVLPGRYTISLFVAGQTVDQKTVRVAAGRTAEVLLEQRDGTLEVRANVSGATVYVDGRALGTTPARITLPPGKHMVRVVALGHRPWRGEVVVGAGGTAVARAELPAWTPSGKPAATKPTPVLPWVLVGLSSASLIAGGVMLVRSQDAADRADRAFARYQVAMTPEAARARRTETLKADEDATSGRRWAVGLFSAGAALAAASVWTFADDAPSVTATGGRDGFGLVWRASW